MLRLARLALLACAALAPVDAALTIYLDRLADAGLLEGREANPLFAAPDGTADVARVLAGRLAAAILTLASYVALPSLRGRPRILGPLAIAAAAAAAVNVIAVINNLAGVLATLGAGG